MTAMRANRSTEMFPAVFARLSAATWIPASRGFQLRWLNSCALLGAGTGSDKVAALHTVHRLGGEQTVHVPMAN